MRYHAAKPQWTGRRLNRDLFNALGVLVLPLSHIISDADLHKLAMHGIELTEYDLDPLSEEKAALRELEASVSTLRHIFQGIRHSGHIPIADIQNEIMPVMTRSMESVQVFPLLLSMRAKDDYTYRHNIAVGALSSMLGRWMGLPPGELAILSIGAVLHDVGKMAIPEHILNKNGRLTDEEYETMKLHTLYGYDMIKQCADLHHRSALIALQHHEREDGSGYPHRLSSERIDYLSKIVAVSDVFHALTSDRVYRKASPFYEILRLMFTGSLGNFDQSILLTFTRRLMNSLIGCEVELTDGTVGQVVLIPPSDPTRPLIRQGERYIDLSKEIHLQMEQIVG
ncbi:HD-GYP domain-containing protein [Cohnella boryungensis]|uniref:HD-GYP domain-containing protein n=1 Tax=Cohnella boryungensis TaxID=768479 RepID=A0ABV8SG16_9BACL